jgi:hypothetical protein
MASGCQKRKPENTEFLLLQHKASPLLWPLVGELLGAASCLVEQANTNK